LSEVGSCPASALGLLTSFCVGEDKRDAGGCGGAKGMVPRLALGKTEVQRELRTGWRKRLPVCLEMMSDGSFEVAGAGTYVQLECENNI
jgi:hypothetical protein